MMTMIVLKRHRCVRCRVRQNCPSLIFRYLKVINHHTGYVRNVVMAVQLMYEPFS